MIQQRLVFGRDRDPGVGEELVERRRGGVAKSNPMLILGPGPAGAICGDCGHLVVRSLARNYYKCDLRRITGGPGSDHRVNWPACARFDPVP